MSVSHPTLESPNNNGSSILCVIAKGLNKLIHASALMFCWSYAALVFAILINVIMRYGFNNGLIVFEEIQWHLYAIGMMFGLSYAEITNSQVRVDIVAERLSKRTVIKWEIVGAVLFILPFVFVVVYNAIPYVASSFSISESSSSPLGLPYRWAIKAVIPISFTLLGLAVISRLLVNIDTLMRKEED